MIPEATPAKARGFFRPIHCNWQRVLPIFAGILAVAILGSAIRVVAANKIPENGYVWKPGEIYRFDYSKSIIVQQNDIDGISEHRTDISGVLILEVKALDDAQAKAALSNPSAPVPFAQSASAVLRFDSAHVVLPDIYFFSSQFDSPQLQKDKNRLVAKAIEVAIKAARWNVTLFPNGTIRYDSRTPASFDAWLSEEKVAGSWRQKSLHLLQNVVEKDLRLCAQGEDYDLFLTTAEIPVALAEAVHASAAPAAADAPARPVRVPSDNSKLHPYRHGLELLSKTGDKLQLGFTRRIPDGHGTSTDITLDAGNVSGKIGIVLDSVDTNQADAVFDSKLGMLDILSETYTAKMTLSAHREKLTQTVKIQYRLKRLAPAILKTE